MKNVWCLVAVLWFLSSCLQKQENNKIGRGIRVPVSLISPSETVPTFVRTLVCKLCHRKTPRCHNFYFPTSGCWNMADLRGSNAGDGVKKCT